MAEQDLPTEVRELIRWNIESIDHMEMLLLLHRSAPRAWSLDELAHELHLPARTTAQCMESLVRGELAVVAREAADSATDPETDPAMARYYGYGPATDALSRAVDMLAREYDERPVALVTAVRSRPSVVLQSFADAFRVRRRS